MWTMTQARMRVQIRTLSFMRMAIRAKESYYDLDPTKDLQIILGVHLARPRQSEARLGRWSRVWGAWPPPDLPFFLEIPSPKGAVINPDVGALPLRPPSFSQKFHSWKSQPTRA